MRAKRKRAVRKPVSKKQSTVGQNKETNKKSAPLLSSAVGQKEEACLNFANQNNKENSRCEDSNDYEVGQPKRDSGNDIHFAGGGSSSSSSESDESFSVEDSSSDDSSIDKRSSKLVKGHGKAKQKSRELSKKEGKGNYNSSRVLRSSNRNQRALMMPPQVLQCNNKDLTSALVVIKKVMQMDEAQPFNVPVDPDALGKPDYLDVIDSPMDFGTICRMLENNVRYINSGDVFKDVKLIWENCCEYHKKGEYIVYLVKRVKKKFMKYWTAAGLGIEQSRKPNGNSHLPVPVDYAMRHSSCDPVHALGNAMDGTRHMQQNRLDPYQLHMQVPTFSYNQFYQPRQPLPSTMSPPFSQFHPSSYMHPYQLQRPQPSSNEPQHSQLPHCADFSSAGHSHFHSPIDSVQNYKNYRPRSSLEPTVSGPANQPQPPQPQLSHSQPCVSQQPQQSTSKLRQSRLQSAPDTGYSHLAPQTDDTRYSGYVPPTDSVVVGPSQQHPQQSPLSNGRLNEPQQLLVSHGHPQSSCLPANGDTENSQVSLTDSAMRGIRCALRYSAGPITDNPSQGDEDQLGPAESHPENTQLNQNQETKSQQQSTKKMKRVRGPTRCLFLRDLPEGQRIIIPYDNQGRPVGSEAAKLSSFLGTIARDGHRAPLTFFNWKEMPDSYKEDMWHLVQEKFDIDPSCKGWVLRSLAIKWNNWKTDIKAKHYYPHKTDEERLKDCPPRIVPDQWPVLISYWNSDTVKMVCATNKANRAKQKGGHTSGQKSYARIIEEERRKRPDGKEPTRAELYILTHTRKDGQPIDEIAATTISKLLEAKKQKTSECSDDSNDTFCQAIGEENPSPIHSDGLGHANDDVHGQKPKGGNLTRMKSHAQKSAKKDVSKVLEKINAVEQKYDRIENQIAALTSNMQKFLDKLGGLPNISGSEQAANP